MSHDPRDILWDDAYYLHYEVRYEEMLISNLLSIWTRIDAATKVLVALTTSGSAVAGWTLWDKEGYRVTWAVLAGTGAILAIVSSSLGVQGRLKEHATARQKFVSLRSKVELLRHDMALDPSFDISKSDEVYKTLKKEYSEAINGEQYDILITPWLEERVQTRLNSETPTQSYA